MHYAYHPSDNAVLSVHEFAGRNWQLQERKRIMMEEITSGIDELGVLLAGHKKNAYWYGSQLSIQEARQLAPHNSATSLQVTVSALAGLIWAIENPNSGVVEPDEMDYKRILEICRPYLGLVVGEYTRVAPARRSRPAVPRGPRRDRSLAVQERAGRCETASCRSPAAPGVNVERSRAARARATGEGTCFCGAIRYRVALPPLWVAHCHCSMCRRAQGARVRHLVRRHRRERFVFARGRRLLRIYRSSPDATRSFCGRCGTPLFFRSSHWPGELHVTLASLDPAVAATLKPQAHAYWSSRAPWLALGDDLPRKDPADHG